MPDIQTPTSSSLRSWAQSYSKSSWVDPASLLVVSAPSSASNSHAHVWCLDNNAQTGRTSSAVGNVYPTTTTSISATTTTTISATTATNTTAKDEDNIHHIFTNDDDNNTDDDDFLSNHHVHGGETDDENLTDQEANLLLIEASSDPSNSHGQYKHNLNHPKTTACLSLSKSLSSLSSSSSSILQQTSLAGVGEDNDNDGHQHHKLSPPPSSTLSQSIFNSINVLMGVGILSLPFALHMTGWIVGSLMLLSCCLITRYTATILAICMDSKLMVVSSPSDSPASCANVDGEQLVVPCTYADMGQIGRLGWSGGFSNT